MAGEVFAVLRKYFEEELQANAGVKTIRELRELMTQVNVAAGAVALSIFGANDSVMNDDLEGGPGIIICVIPPGGAA